MPHDKNFIAAAMNQTGYEKWHPNFDVPNLNRPRSRPTDLPGKGRIAAVLLLLFATGDRADANLVLTRRRSHMSKHPGQISFPGGRQDTGESLQETALREANEEIGINPNDIELIGRLNTVYIPPSDFTVTPFVGWHQGAPKLKPAESEVAEILEVPITTLLDPTTLIIGKVETWNKEDPTRPRKIDAPFYAVGPHQIWGATAIMLDEFIDRLRKFAN